MLEHGNRIEVDPETQREIIRRYEKESTRQISKDYPFSRNVINRILKENRVPLRKTNERGNRDTKTHTAWDNVDNIIYLYEKLELSVFYIAPLYGCSPPTITEILKENGIPRRGRHSRPAHAGGNVYREACEDRKRARVTEASFYLAGGKQKLVVKYDNEGKEI